MSSMSVDGLVSGLSTSSLISQLMQVEALPQAALKAKVRDQQAERTALQAVNAKMAALQTAADKLGQAGTWKAAAVTSSSEAVKASTGPGAVSGEVTFAVDRLASAHAIRSTSVATGLDQEIATSFPIEITRADGTVTRIHPTDGTFGEIVRAVNAAGTAGVRAAAVQVAPGQYRLQLSSTTSGAGSEFTVSGLDGLDGFVTAQQGQDAQLTMGSGPGAYTVVSSSNTFTDVLPGVTFTATATAPAVTLRVEPDAAGTRDKVKGLVDAANAVLDEIARVTKSDPGAAGVLVGDSTLRRVAQQVLSAVTDRAGGTSMAAQGVQLGRDGRLVLDPAAFDKAYAADPAKVQAAFRTAPAAAGDPTPPPGFAQRLSTVADAASDATTGTITGAIRTRDGLVRDLETRVAGWDDRLALRKAALQKQFSAMEVALSGLQQQSSWLAGQLAGLAPAAR